MNGVNRYKFWPFTAVMKERKKEGPTEGKEVGGGGGRKEEDNDWGANRCWYGADALQGHFVVWETTEIVINFRFFKN